MKEYYAGQSASFSKTVSESDVYTFAGITGDFNYVHVDAPRAGQSAFGARVAHGALISGFISTVIGMYLPGPGTIYMQQNSKFLLPVEINDTITAIVEVAELINPKKGVLRLLTRVENQRGEVVLTGEAVVKSALNQKEVVE